MRILLWLVLLGVPYAALGLPVAGLFALALVIAAVDLISTNYIEVRQR